MPCCLKAYYCQFCSSFMCYSIKWVLCTWRYINLFLMGAGVRGFELTYYHWYPGICSIKFLTFYSELFCLYLKIVLIPSKGDDIHFKTFICLYMGKGCPQMSRNCWYFIQVVSVMLCYVMLCDVFFVVALQCHKLNEHYAHHQWNK